VSVDLVVAVDVLVAGREIAGIDYIVDLGDIGVLQWMIRERIISEEQEQDLDRRRLLPVSFRIIGKEAKREERTRIVIIPLPTHTQTTNPPINPDSWRTNVFLLTLSLSLTMSPIRRRSITTYKTRNLLSESTCTRVTSMLRLLSLSD